MTSSFSFLFTVIHCLPSLKTLVPKSVFLIAPSPVILLCNFSVYRDNQSYILVYQLFASLFLMALTSTLLQHLLPGLPSNPEMTPNCPYLKILNPNSLHSDCQLLAVLVPPFSHFIKPFLSCLYTIIYHLQNSLVNTSHSLSICPSIIHTPQNHTKLIQRMAFPILHSNVVKEN